MGFSVFTVVELSVCTVDTNLNVVTAGDHRRDEAVSSYLTSLQIALFLVTISARRIPETI